MARSTVHIQNLMSLFIKIEKGELQIPTFQRDFIWNKKNIIQLLDAIYNGLPIGTIYIVRPQNTSINSKGFNFKTTKRQATPNSEYIIDGVQRLTALYYCLFVEDRNKDPMFKVGFNLKNKQFEHLKSKPNLDTIVELTSVFSSTQFIDGQQRLLTHSSSVTNLIREMNHLYSTFREYEMPVITITDVDLKDITAIFQILNTTGTRLTKQELLLSNKGYK